VDEEIFSYSMNDDDDQDHQHHLLMTLIFPLTKFKKNLFRRNKILLNNLHHIVQKQFHLKDVVVLLLVVYIVHKLVDAIQDQHHQL
jgi:hypothetical protein